MQINLLCSDLNLPQNLLTDESAKTVNWGGVDRGALILIQHHIKPYFAVGDFDSVNEEERHKLYEQLHIHPVKAEKDDTDLALAVSEAIQLGFDDITIYGATGGRLDHFFGAVQLLLKPEYQEQDISIRIVDAQNKIKLLNVGTHTIEKSPDYYYVSFIPVNGEVILTLSGFKYNLSQQHLQIGSTLTISNEVHENIGHINVEQGQVLQIESIDRRK